MKSRIFMYLFIFALLAVVFQYVNSKNILDKYEEDITKLKGKNKVLEEQTLQLQEANEDLSYFRVEGNEDALSYFESLGYKTEELIPAIRDGLYNMNNYEGDDHPIVPYASMTDQQILINRVRILNHKWILANFTDGKHWGEIFVTYELDDKGGLTYDLGEYFLYPVNQY
ncbi:hydrolase [Winogradskyella maritima]|uniref:Hydrolase n=1 Tax=Winogradskyella maritima TaxID=1517766 RepID=A0ABV8AKP0_9FLAO|nr:hydrolase [Winogradskyella maritima]